MSVILYDKGVCRTAPATPGLNILSKFELPSSYGLGMKVFEDIFTKDELVS